MTAATDIPRPSLSWRSQRAEKKPQLPVHVLLTREESGLKEDSIVLTEQVRTLEKTRLTRYLGTVTAQAMKRIDRALGMSIGST